MKNLYSLTLSLILLGSFTVAIHAANENHGFERTTLAIGTLVNKANSTGDIRHSERSPFGAASNFEFEASKQIDPNQTKQLHTYMASFTAGGHSNWHSHPGLELAINPTTSSPLVFYILNRDGSCRKQTLAPGQSLLVLPGETHMVRSETDKAATLLVERIHPGELPVTTDQLQPLGSGTCPIL